MEPERPNRDKFLDELLDRSLRQYSRVEPRVGLEGRILRRLEERQPSRFAAWFSRWQWAAAGAAAVALLAVTTLLTLRTVPMAQRSSTPGVAQKSSAPAGGGAASVPAPEPQQIAKANIPAPNRQPRYERARRNTSLVRPGAFARPSGAESREAPAIASVVPKRAVFPTPTPPTEQEMLLARVAATADPQALRALAAVAQQPIRELEIAPLKIEPLSEPTENSSGPVPKP